jgi:hypothetical protein
LPKLRTPSPSDETRRDDTRQHHHLHHHLHFQLALSASPTGNHSLTPSACFRVSQHPSHTPRSIDHPSDVKRQSGALLGHYRPHQPTHGHTLRGAFRISQDPLTRKGVSNGASGGAAAASKKNRRTVVINVGRKGILVGPRRILCYPTDRSGPFAFLFFAPSTSYLGSPSILNSSATKVLHLPTRSSRVHAPISLVLRWDATLTLALRSDKDKASTEAPLRP